MRVEPIKIANWLYKKKKRDRERERERQRGG